MQDGKANEHIPFVNSMGCLIYDDDIARQVYVTTLVEYWP